MGLFKTIFSSSRRRRSVHQSAATSEQTEQDGETGAVAVAVEVVVAGDSTSTAETNPTAGDNSTNTNTTIATTTNTPSNSNNNNNNYSLSNYIRSRARTLSLPRSRSSRSRNQRRINALNLNLQLQLRRSEQSSKKIAEEMTAVLKSLMHLRLNTVPPKPVPAACIICSEDLESCQIVTRLPCKHLYHSSCLLNWFLHSTNLATKHLTRAELQQQHSDSTPVQQPQSNQQSQHQQNQHQHQRPARRSTWRFPSSNSNLASNANSTPASNVNTNTTHKQDKSTYCWTCPTCRHVMTSNNTAPHHVTEALQNGKHDQSQPISTPATTNNNNNNDVQDISVFAWCGSDTLCLRLTKPEQQSDTHPHSDDVSGNGDAANESTTVCTTPPTFPMPVPIVAAA